jgi:hypothetical protein
VAKPIRLLWAAVFLYVVLIFILSAQPGLNLPGEFEYRDKIAHTIEYGGLSWLVERAARATWPGAPGLKRALFAIFAISALGAADEVFPGRCPGAVDTARLDGRHVRRRASQFRSFTSRGAAGVLTWHSH